MAPKSQPALNSDPTPIETDKGVQASNAILSELKSGLAKNKTSIDSLILESYVGRQPQTTARADKARRPTVSRTDQLRDRLARNRAAVPEEKASSEPPPGELPAAVNVALEIIRTSRSAPPVLDRRALIEQLRNDGAAISIGIAAQQDVHDALVEDLRYRQVLKDADPWFSLLVRRFRAYQAAAALDDELGDFQRARLDAGFVPWRGDLLPELGLRVKLTLGSERDFDSEISRMRRRLEELKKL